jgi:dihydroorotate dehydrogenase
VAVNVSSPNTKGLRDLQGEDALDALLAALKNEQQLQSDRHGKYTPIAVKIAPDLDPTASRASPGCWSATHRRRHAAATWRDAVRGVAADETGGLSGRPAQATQVVRTLARR